MAMTTTAMDETKDGHIWIAIGDIHDQTGNFKRIPELENAKGIIVTGDLTQYGGIEAASKVLKELKMPGVIIYAQTGNMDKPEIDEWLTGTGINIHAQVVEIAPETAMFGIGGSTPTPFNTPTEYPESTYSEWLKICWLKASQFPAQILISHNPPKDTACDRISSDAHVGSVAVREFIEKCQPTLCICGHIHESIGVDHIGKTKIINPGMLAEGVYAIIRIANAKVTAELRKLDI